MQGGSRTLNVPSASNTSSLTSISPVVRAVVSICFKDEVFAREQLVRAICFGGERSLSLWASPGDQAPARRRHRRVQATHH